MADRLDRYRAKRVPGRTPEPFGGARVAAEAPGAARLFVVQKHAARRLHWDFRLELGGTLRSWAVPKGPSADPAERRLAVEVEDHPVEYADFEGIIPAGNYGAGAVIVWDRGSWQPLGDPVKGLEGGKLTFLLHGDKLRGEWTLVRTRRVGDKQQWLLMKHRGDAFAGPGRPFPEESVLSGRLLEEVAAEGGRGEATVRAGARARRPARGPRPRGSAAGAHERVTAISNPDKVFFPAEGITKGDLVAYHRAIAPFMLPFLADRPLVLTRYPDGIEGKSFFQKDAPAWRPPWLRTVTVHAEDAGRDLEHFLVDDADGLAWLVNLGTIPIHVFASRATALERPDWCVVDLDPKEAPFAHVVTLARALHALCEDIGLPSYPKTTGQKGLHVLVPLGGQLTHGQARALGELLARAIEAEHPDLSTTARALRARGRRVYLDYLQNGYGKTIAAPYTVRPRPGAPVSAPLRWREVNARLDPSRFTIRNMRARAERLGADPLRPVIEERPELVAALDRLRARLVRRGAARAP
ncbi:non-homologous end-joining DNA ligase [Anaeromyxobacter oryzisoli]|uniref:non-homologous end-joining DNA ligase n=1 Tax=Anaeromyxobacter oryzisoli TaxID=2925408 RepID=UPI001F5A9809|nr:non-homologous end-joining DNA ligase [Anaeromyxobacter sp. SG63]